MVVMQLLKHDLADLRNKMAREYRAIRKQDHAKARILFRRMRVAVALTERSLLENVFGKGNKCPTSSSLTSSTPPATKP